MASMLQQGCRYMTDFPKKHPLLWAYLFAAYFSLCYHIPIYATGMSGFIGLRETILMSLMWLVPILLAPDIPGNYWH
ncbi:hypothetical protein [Porticoccus sp.]|uniref:hypothetical protein n=1 Tax=Porticoccus sp. TaxID=2024853 RepID=UPI003F698DA7